MNIVFKALNPGCCFSVEIAENGETVGRGVWCSASHRLAIDGEIVGWAETQEELVANLRRARVVTWEWSLETA